MLFFLQSLNLALRFGLELVTLAAVGYWGFRIGKGPLWAWGFGLGAPLLIAVIWGAFGSPNAPVPVQGVLLLLLELAVFGSGAAALCAGGFTRLAFWFTITYVINRLLMYYWGQ
jgi:hypothetical protein